MSVLSLYIPIISESTSEDYIKSSFQKKNIGRILRVDFVHNIQKNRREAFIHFDEWFDTTECIELKESILNPNIKAKLYHTNERFWPLLVNKNAHKRNNNPNYKVLENYEVKTACATSLNIIKAEPKLKKGASISKKMKQ